MKRLRSSSDLDSYTDNHTNVDGDPPFNSSDRPLSASSHRWGRRGPLSPSRYHRDRGDDPAAGLSRSLSRRRSNLDFDGGSSNRRIKDPDVRFGREDRLLHRSESGSSRRAFPKGFRSERERPNREASVSSSWRRFGGPGNDFGRDRRGHWDGERERERERERSVKSPSWSRDSSNEQVRVKVDSRNSRSRSKSLASPTWSKDSGSEQSKSVGKKSEEVHGGKSGSEMEEGELEPEPEPQSQPETVSRDTQDPSCATGDQNSERIGSSFQEMKKNADFDVDRERNLSLSLSHTQRSTMGSLPPTHLDFSSANHQDISKDNLVSLFKSQQDLLNHFFKHLDLSQTLSFSRLLLSASGTVFFTGVGKSAFVANKVSQTLVSLSFRSSFLSPLDALHGDIGALSPRDILVLFSKSGATEELLRLVPCAKARGAFLVSLTSVPGNPLAGVCDMNVHLPLERELCPFNLAPVTSTAIQMVFGDTIAVALMAARNLTKEEYGANHPAGRIGKSLIFKVKDVMKKKDELPVCKEGDLIMDQLVELTSKGCGCLLVVDEGHRLIGTFTDGDLRRTLKASGEAIFKLTVGEMCNRKPRTIGSETMAVEAMKKMESPPSPVQFLPVVNEDNTLIGIVTLHGLVSAGL